LQPHGARVGSIKDPFDNTWYIASQQQAIGKKSEEPERTAMGAPNLFRIALQVGDLAQAGEFYSKLLDDPGIPIPRGSRHYFNCGEVEQMCRASPYACPRFRAGTSPAPTVKSKGDQDHVSQTNS